MVNVNVVFELLSNYMNLRETKDPVLATDAIKFLCSMFCHKKIVLEWVQNGGVQILLNVPRPSIAATAVSQCLYYIACDEDSMEKVCQLPPSVLQKMIRYYGLAERIYGLTWRNIFHWLLLMSLDF